MLRTKANWLTPVRDISGNGKDAAREAKATCTQEGDNLTMKWEGAGITTGTFQDNNFTMNDEGMIFSHRKQGNGTQPLEVKVSRPFPTILARTRKAAPWLSKAVDVTSSP